MQSSSNINIQPGTLVILCGPSGSGKSTFVRDYAASWIINPDSLRINLQGLQPNYQSSNIPSRADNTIWDISYQLLDYRMKEGLTTIFDATSLTNKTRNRLINYADKYSRPYVIIYFNKTKSECIGNIKLRNGTTPIFTDPSLVEEQFKRLEVPDNYVLPAPLKLCPWTIPDEEELIIIGDVHGLIEPLKSLLYKLGFNDNFVHPEGLKVCFVGDVIDRGPQNVETLFFVKDLVDTNRAYLVKGNHEAKLSQLLKGNHSLNGSTWGTYEDYLQLNPSKKDITSLANWIDSLPYYYLYRDYVITHGNISFFDEYLTSLKEMNVGCRDHNFDTDSNYNQAYMYGLIKYKLIRGHVAPTSPERLDNVIVLEDNPAQAFGGSILYYHNNQIKKEYCNGYMYQPLFEDPLIKEAKDNKYLSITPKSNNTIVYKYTAKCYGDDTCWKRYPFLLEMAGLIISKGGKVIQHPFDKLFHPSTNLPKEVLAVDKLNGYMIAATSYHNKLFISTKGGNTEGEYIFQFWELINRQKQGNKLKELLFKNPNKSFMFEVIHRSDYDNHPTIQTEEKVVLIGARTKNSSIFDTEQQLDEYGLFRPQYQIVDTQSLLEECTYKPLNIEGYILRDVNTQEYICKAKNVFYNFVKAFSRKHTFDGCLQFVLDLKLDNIEYLEEKFKDYRKLPPLERVIKTKELLGDLLL